MDQKTEQATIKVFFALWPSDAERHALSAWQPTLEAACGGRSMRRDSLHATLVFLGQVGQDRLEALKLAAQEADAAKFEVEFDTARYWGHNHIVYAAPSGVPQELARLVEVLERSLRRHRFRFDRRAYKPRVTLLRNAHWTDVPLPTMTRVCWKFRDYALVQSAPQGYRVLARFPLNFSMQQAGG